MKIYDCFIFSDENLLTEIRLNTLNKYVDIFVVIECKYTHQGNIKGQNFQNSLFDKFKHKIRYFYIEDVIQSNNSWVIESWQRNQISKGLYDCDKNDLIMISDVDEIPNLDGLKLSNIKSEVLAFEQKLLMYKLNLLREKKWIGTKLCKFSTFKSPQWLRQIKVHKRYSLLRIDKFFSKTYYKNFKIIKNGGWHFGWLKSTENIIKKVQSYAHREHNISKFKDYHYISECLKNNINFLNGYEKMRVMDKTLLPKYINENLAKYKEWIL